MLIRKTACAKHSIGLANLQQPDLYLRLVTQDGDGVAICNVHHLACEISVGVEGRAIAYAPWRLRRRLEQNSTYSHVLFCGTTS